MSRSRELDDVLTICQQVQIAVASVEENLGDGTTAGEAEAAGMPLRSFHRSFVALTGNRSGEHGERCRLSKALGLPATSHNSMIEIAASVGHGRHKRSPGRSRSGTARHPGRFGRIRSRHRARNGAT